VANAWRDGVVRPTHRNRPTVERTWRTRADPFADSSPVVEGWLIAEPSATAKELTDRLAVMVPTSTQARRTCERCSDASRAWRAEKAKDLILGSLRHAKATAPMEG
jgi:hypothetical protein